MNGLPRHVAIIMDGNGRWARRRQLPRHSGHRAGVKAARAIIEECAAKGISALTLFAFSSENWRRPQTEVGLLMELFLTTLQREAKRLKKNNIRLRVIGDRSGLAEKLQNQISESERTTEHNTGLNLNIAANYGGRWDITEATRVVARKIKSGELSTDDLTAEVFGKELALSELPEPDLFIRTGGEQRISNFMLWQLAYTELYFTESLWPDFSREAFEEALEAYSARQRRFGRTGDQVDQRRENV